ncbi:MAG: hypothetical protein K2K57_00685 [Oscillospiraceae bacterium]|nr:hypothetical protein [Oscillospiraceae bacterium]
MYIKEFEIAVDILPPDNEVKEIALRENLSYEDAEKKWYIDIRRALYNKTVEETRCICAYFQRLFPKVQLGDFWKLTVILTNRQTYREIMTVGGVCEIRIFFDHKELIDSDDHDKKQRTLELLMTGLKKFSDISGYPYEEFEKCADIIRNSDYNNTWVWQQKKRGKKRALVTVHHEVRYIDFTFEVYNGNDLLYSNVKQITPPDEWFYSFCMGNIKWESSDRVVWYSRKGEVMDEFNFG